MSPQSVRPSDAWSPLDFEHEIGRVDPSDATCKRFARSGVRMSYGAKGGSGTADIIRCGEDVVLSIVNCVLPVSTRWRYDTDEPLIMLRASLSCDVSFTADGGAPVLFNRPEVALVCVPAGCTLDVDINGGARQQGIVSVFRAATFASRYELRHEDLPMVVREALGGSGSIGRIAAFPLDHRIAGLVAETIDSRLDGEMRVIQCSARLAELVAYTLDAMQHTPSLSGAALQRQRDVELAHAAMTTLSRDYRKPPLFADLAKKIGTNQNKLKAVFKDAFGVTMADYCLERRMREAQQLLLEAKLNIAQVAERVGYEHQSSFTAAFGGFVGMSPREYRQHRAPFTMSLGAAYGEHPAPAVR